MRNPLKRRPSHETKLTLRERLAATKAGVRQATVRAGKAATAARIMLQKPKPEPMPVDRAALVTYASWLMMERKLVCDELFPHMAGKAHAFLIEAPGANDFHFPPGRSWRDVPPPSSRAIGVLDLLGIRWSSKAGDSDSFDPGASDDRESTAQAYGWPKTDAEILTALVDLRRLDNAIEALLAHAPADRDQETIPGYAELSEARSGVLEVLQDYRAVSLPGLQAKAKALRVESVLGDWDAGRSIAHSLARDLIGARDDAVTPRPDPIRLALADLERLEAESAALLAKGNVGDLTPEQDACVARISAHWDDVVLKTVPTTALGCATLARAARAHCDRWSISFAKHGAPALDLIARSPLL